MNAVYFFFVFAKSDINPTQSSNSVISTILYPVKQHVVTVGQL